MNTIAIIVAYFGKLPSYFPLWAKSCGANPDIDFLVFTNDTTEYTRPTNVKINRMSFEHLRDMAQRCFDFPICLDRPYKLCDYKVAYGEIFSEWLQGYTFWGHCDLDQLMGDLRKYLTDERLNNYDKLYRMGHLTLYRNVPEVNALYLDAANCGWVDYKTVFSSNIDFAFDECGIPVILKRHPEIRYLDEMDGMDLCWEPDFLWLGKEDAVAEAKWQSFFWQEGHTYQAYSMDGKTVQLREGAYIHFGNRKMQPFRPVQNNTSGIYLLQDGFSDKSVATAPTPADMQLVNPYPGRFRLRVQHWTTYFRFTIYRRTKRKAKLLWRKVKSNAH